MILWRQGVFVGTLYWTLPPLFLSCVVWSSVSPAVPAPALIPAPWLFSIAALRSAVKDMIGISADTFGKMKGGPRKQATLIQNEAIVWRWWFCRAILPKCVSPSFFYALSDVFWRRQLWTSLRRRRQLPLCSHGNPLGGNNFAFIKFKVGLYCWGRSLQQDGRKRNFHTARCLQEVLHLFSPPCKTINGAAFKGRLSPSTIHHQSL